MAERSLREDRGPRHPDPSGRARRACFAMVVCALGLLASTAHARGRAALQRALDHAEAADFEAALSAFDEAEASADLERADLVRLFSHRAIVHFALGHAAALEADLERLLALSGDAALPVTAPPPLERAFEALRERSEPFGPTLASTSEVTDAGAVLRARVERDPTRLVRGVRVYGRVSGGPWQGGHGDVVVLAAQHRTIEWYAEGLGPGGVVVAKLGDAHSPERLRISPRRGESLPRATGPDFSDRKTGKTKRRWWVGTGVAATVVAVAITTLALSSRSASSTTHVAGPTLSP